jgi:hypothetical protein
MSGYGGSVPAVVAVVCPHPPLLVPAMAGRAAWELTELRSTCDAAVNQLWAAEPDQIVIVGAGASTETYSSSAIGSFAGYGLPLAVRLGGGDVDTGATAAPLPLSLSVGAWLLRDRPVEPRRAGVSVAPDSAVECARLGASLVSGPSRLGLLIMGDGSACHGPKSPGYDDPRATSFDAHVANALSACDTASLLALDIDLAADLLVAGRAPWQVLAGAIDASGGTWTGSVTYADAPYGVQYTVATWLPVSVDVARAA